jgi:hypothetical protein
MFFGKGAYRASSQALFTGSQLKSRSESIPAGPSLPRKKSVQKHILKIMTKVLMKNLPNNLKGSKQNFPIL